MSTPNLLSCLHRILCIVHLNMVMNQVPINYASEEELQNVRGIGPKSANAIAKARQTVGNISQITLPFVLMNPVN